MDGFLLVLLAFVAFSVLRDYFYYGDSLERIFLGWLMPGLSFLFLKTVSYVLLLGGETYQIVFFFFYMGFIMMHETEVSKFRISIYNFPFFLRCKEC